MAEDNRRNHEYEESVRAAREAVCHNVGGPILARRILLGEAPGKAQGYTPPEHLQSYPVEIIDEHVLEHERFHGRPFKQEPGPVLLQVPFGSLVEQERTGRTIHEMMEEATSNPPEGFEVGAIVQDSIMYREKPRFVNVSADFISAMLRKDAIKLRRYTLVDEPRDPGFYAPLSGMPGPRVVNQKRKHRDRKAAKAARAARRRNR